MAESRRVRLPLTTLDEQAPYLTRWVKPNFERTVGNRTQGQPGFGASRGLHHKVLVAVFVGGYRNGRHNTFPKCQNYKPFRLERMAAI